MVFTYVLGGDLEVLLPEVGFSVAYFVATLLFEIEEGIFYIVFHHLFDDDGFTYLREVVPIEQVRPCPPYIVSSGFSVGDLADVYLDGGWWVCRVVFFNPDSGWYDVVLEVFDELVSTTIVRMRLHQQWEEGRWVIVLDLIL
ncbi:hypothetical protein RND81_14G232500 [Saponaria officinalis]|uniref:Agenet-like domain-containing protein n=1 Tax=Saponaria officinalis TaxID=3572 RepID=A0AAW1GVY7_SAPOF